MHELPAIAKYPRTLHLEGSRLPAGERDELQTPFRDLAGCHLVVEEKIDGAQAALSFSSHGELLLQSRGHYLSGGPAERQFSQLKPWAQTIAGSLRERLEDRYVLYGEWLQAKHTVFYDILPHLFLEFDILDRSDGRFLDTARRRALLAGLPVVSVPVLHEGALPSLAALTALVRPSLYKSAHWQQALAEESATAGVAFDQALAETEPSSFGEGLYVKVEQDGQVVGRYKWVRHAFLRLILDSGSHWAARPLIANRLAPDATLY